MAGQTRGLIFDFDGTIADSLQPILAIVNRLSTELGYRRIPDEGRELLREKGAREVLHEIGIPLLRAPFIMKRVREALNSEIADISPIPGMAEALRELHAAKVPLGILSSNSRKNVVAFLRHRNLDFFDFVHSDSSLFGKSVVLRRLLRERQLAPTDFFYVGDETRDIEAARATRMPMIAVSWGFNSENALRGHSPEHLITRPPDLVALWRREAARTTAP